MNCLFDTETYLIYGLKTKVSIYFIPLTTDL